MGDVTLRRDDVLDESFLVQHDLGFGQVEVDRSATLPPAVQHFEELAHQLEQRHQRTVLFNHCRIAIRQDGIDGGIRHSRVASDDAVVQFVPNDLPLWRYLHQAGLDEPVHMRVEAAQPGRQFRRKHVDGALRKVDRRGALVRFGIQRAALSHVMRDVGDVHAEPEVPVRQPRKRNRVIEIARVLAVDGHDGAIAKVGPACDVAVAHVLAQPARLGDRLGAVRVGNLVLVDDDFGVDTRIVGISQDLDHAADRAARRGRPLRDLDNHHGVRLGVARFAARNPHVCGQPLVERDHPRQAGSFQIEPAHDRRRSSFDDLQDASLRAAVRALPLHANDDAIAMERAIQLVCGDDDVARHSFERLIGGDKADAGRGRLETADDLVHPLRQPVAVAAEPGQRAVARQVSELSLEGVSVFAADSQDANQLTSSGGMRNASAHLPQ